MEAKVGGSHRHFPPFKLRLASNPPPALPNPNQPQEPGKYFICPPPPFRQIFLPSSHNQNNILSSQTSSTPSTNLLHSNSFPSILRVPQSIKMKSSMMIAVGAFALSAVAQGDLPSCGQTCIHNMLALAPSLGCAPNDASCLCSNPNFGYGIRDCSTEACGAEVASSVIAYGGSYCSSAVSASGSATATGPASTGVTSTTLVTSASTTVTGSSSAITTSALVSGSSTIGSTTIFGVGAGGAGRSSAITTSAIESIVSSGGSAIATTTVGSSTIYGAASSAASGASSAASGASSGASSVASSASSAVARASSSAASGASSAASHASSATSAAGGAATTSSSTGGAAQKTAFPMLAAAGLAAYLL